MTYTPKAGSDTERVLALIRNEDRALRTPEICRLLGMTAAQVGSALKLPAQHGLVVVCRVKNATGANMNEYRPGSGIPMVSQGDYDPKKRAVKFGRKPQPMYPPAPAARPAPVQPAVTDNNTGSDTPATTSSPAAVAVAAATATPAPKAKPGIGPAKRKAPAGDDIHFIDKVQAMTDFEFADYIAFQIRLRAWRTV